MHVPCGNADAGRKAPWAWLRGRRLGGIKFRRQNPMPPFFLDFYSNEVSLVIELDGASHEGSELADASRETCADRWPRRDPLREPRRPLGHARRVHGDPQDRGTPPLAALLRQRTSTSNPRM